MRRLAALLGFVLVSCGDDSGQDASVEDVADMALPEPCLRNTRLDLEPVLPADCDVCQEPHVRVAFPRWYGGVGEIEMHAVPGGAVILADGPGALVSFVTTDGQVIPLEDVPAILPRPDFYGLLGRYLALLRRKLGRGSEP